MTWGYDATVDYNNDKPSRGKSNRGWRHQLKLDEAPVRVHFGAPEELYRHPRAASDTLFPYRTGFRHWIPWGNGGKGAYVECGDGSRCVVCAYTNPKAHGIELDPNSKLAGQPARSYVSVAGWTEEWFHNVEFYRDEQDKSKGTFHARERCTGRGCTYCAQNIERVYGNKNYIVFSASLWRTLIELQRDTAETYCQCGDRCYIPEYICPSCSSRLIDVCCTCERCESENISIDDESYDAECEDCHVTWSVMASGNEGIMKEVSRKHRCHNCNTEVYPKPVHACMNPECAGQPRSIFEMQLTLKVTGTGVDKKLHIVDWKFQEPDPRLFDATYQGENPEWAEKIAMGNTKVFNLEQFFPIEEPDAQAQAISVENPFAIAYSGTTRAIPRSRT